MRWALALVAAALLSSAAFAAGEVVQKGDVRVGVGAEMTPRVLPRDGLAPVSVTVSGQVLALHGAPVPQLQQMKIDVNRHGRFDYSGLPACPIDRIQPATTAQALAACRTSLVGQGTFSAQVVLQGQTPYPTKGRLLVFNGIEGGRHVLLGQIYTAKPFTNSFVIVFRIRAVARGRFGTALVASLPDSLGGWGHVTGIEMTLSRRWSAGGHRHSYVSAGCPAPPGFSRVAFPLARATFRFAGGTRLSSTVSRGCRARG